MAGTFSKSIAEWALETQERIDAVHARSVELLAEEMTRTKPEGGRVPFLVGNLSRSLQASKSGMPNTSAGPFSGSNVGLVTATLKASETVWLGYQAAYAARMNYGFVGADSLGRVYNQQGNYFIEAATVKWTQLVEQAAEEVKGNSL